MDKLTKIDLNAVWVADKKVFLSPAQEVSVEIRESKPIDGTVAFEYPSSAGTYWAESDNGSVVMFIPDVTMYKYIKLTFIGTEQWTTGDVYTIDNPPNSVVAITSMAFAGVSESPTPSGAATAIGAGPSFDVDPSGGPATVILTFTNPQVLTTYDIVPQPSIDSTGSPVTSIPMKWETSLSTDNITYTTPKVIDLTGSAVWDSGTQTLKDAFYKGVSFA